MFQLKNHVLIFVTSVEFLSWMHNNGFLELVLIMSDLKSEIDILIRTHEKRRLFTRDCLVRDIQKGKQALWNNYDS